MNRVFCVALLVAVAAPPAAAQDSNARLRKAIAATPSLAAVRVTINVDPKVTLTGVSAVTADAAGNIYVLHRPNRDADPIVVLDREGRFLRSWGRGLFEIPHGIRVDPSGHVWATESSKASKVMKFSTAGEKLLEIDVARLVPAHGIVQRDAPSPQVGATDVAFGPGGTVYVADGYQNARILVFDADGRLVREWGRPGSGPGEFRLPHGLAIHDSRVYVADRENGRVQWFDLNGVFQGEWTFGGQLYSVALGPTGGVWVSTHPSDVPLEQEFNVVRVDPRTGEMQGTIEVRAHELAVDGQGRILPATRSSDLPLFTVQ